MSANSQRILITGANGHLGRRLILRLADLAHPVSVRAVVRSQRAADALLHLPEHARPEIFVLDYSDAEALTRAAEGCHYAVHLAGIIKESSTSRFADAHEATTTALARAADRTGLRRVVYLSILGSEPDSTNPCLASKGRAERILLEAATPVLVLRVPMVIGPGDFVSKALAREAQASFAPLLRGGAVREQPIDADDVIAAVLAGLDLLQPEGAANDPGHCALDGVALDLAGPVSLSRRELLERTAALYGNRPRVVPIPLALEMGVAWLFEKTLRDPPLSRAMVGVLDHDDDIDVSDSCKRLGIQLTPLDETLRRCVGPEANR